MPGKPISKSKNKGLAKSIIDGVSQIVEEFGKVIVLEDDLLVSPSFLDFMNEALLEYENEEAWSLYQKLQDEQEVAVADEYDAAYQVDYQDHKGEQGYWDFTDPDDPQWIYDDEWSQHGYWDYTCLLYTSDAADE